MGGDQDSERRDSLKRERFSPLCGEHKKASQM